jgi:hypothetical protein
MKVNIPDYLGDTSKPIELGFNDTLSEQDFRQVWNTMQRLDDPGARVGWDELALMVSRMVTVDGKQMTGPQFGNMLHGEWSMMYQFVALCTKWMSEILEAGKKIQEDQA